MFAQDLVSDSSLSPVSGKLRNGEGWRKEQRTRDLSRTRSMIGHLEQCVKKFQRSGAGDFTDSAPEIPVVSAITGAELRDLRL